MPEDKSGNLILSLDQQPVNEGKLPKSRIDVEITEQVYYGKPCYVVKDPTSLRYYRLRPPEYTIYKMLDGSVGMEDILRALAERFPDEKYDSQAVMSFIVMLRGAGLLHVPGSSDTDYLLDRKKKLTRSIFQRVRKEFLFFRISILDPDRILNWLHAHLGSIVFSRGAGIVVLAMLAGAVALLLKNIDKMGQAQPLLSWINMLYFMPSLFLIKIIHEFGHGLTSKHYDTEVHEMGILFLVFMPCAYCDVSDAWMISQKNRRMWITAAGIVVEIVLAGLATYVWALTMPKTVINQFALNVMVAASLNTILFNGNPLLRYDGYYFLMDMIEIPNLKQKSSGYLWYLLQKYVLGADGATEPLDVRGREPGVFGYAICSAVYRWFIMFAIVGIVWRFLDPYGWGVVGAVMAVGCIYTSFFMPIGKFFKYLTMQRHRLHVRLVTAGVLVVVILAAVGLVLALPVEQSIETQCVVRPAGLHPLYVTQPGFILRERNERFVRDGQAVEAGDTLLVLADPELEHSAGDLKLQLEQLQLQWKQARQGGAAQQAELAQIEAQFKGLKAQYERAKHNIEKLTIRAPVGGIVQLRTKEPLDNLVGSFLPLQAALFAVYEANAFEAVAAINHRDNGLIEPCQVVEIKLWPYDSVVLNSRVVTKPPSPVWKMSSPAFSAAFGGEVATMPAASPEEALEPADNTYELVVPLDAVAGMAEDGMADLRDGMVGRAKVIVERKTLAEAFYLWLIRTVKQDIRL